ncbi:unnamed protein product [Amoebophrya sp. A120]|nr:unnamed protein product [Amoebophrya sp. A120]|eukprot:GSA120T00009798001.1
MVVRWCNASLALSSGSWGGKERNDSQDPASTPFCQADAPWCLHQGGPRGTWMCVADPLAEELRWRILVPGKPRGTAELPVDLTDHSEPHQQRQELLKDGKGAELPSELQLMQYPKFPGRYFVLFPMPTSKLPAAGPSTPTGSGDLAAAQPPDEADATATATTPAPGPADADPAPTSDVKATADQAQRKYNDMSTPHLAVDLRSLQGHASKEDTKALHKWFFGDEGKEKGDRWGRKTIRTPEFMEEDGFDEKTKTEEATPAELLGKAVQEAQLDDHDIGDGALLGGLKKLNVDDQQNKSTGWRHSAWIRFGNIVNLLQTAMGNLASSKKGCSLTEEDSPTINSAEQMENQIFPNDAEMLKKEAKCLEDNAVSEDCSGAMKKAAEAPLQHPVFVVENPSKLLQPIEIPYVAAGTVVGWSRYRYRNAGDDFVGPLVKCHDPSQLLKVPKEIVNDESSSDEYWSTKKNPRYLRHSDDAARYVLHPHAPLPSAEIRCTGIRFKKIYDLLGNNEKFVLRVEPASPAGFFK